MMKFLINRLIDMPISRTRRVQHKVHIPSSARENQYLLAKFAITDSLIERISGPVDHNSEQPFLPFYKKLSELFFKINEELDIESGQFVANDKFTRIRFSPEKITAQTDQQILFLYNSRYHFSQKAYFDATKQASKIHLVFLSNGDEIRHDSAIFHQKVVQAITQFTEQSGMAAEEVRICDHQHLTYDLFAKDKGIQGNQVHKLRSISNRYAPDEISIPANTDELTYAVVDMPINRRLRKLVKLDHSEGENYNPLYNYIADAFISAAKKHNLNNGALIANGLVPIVRRSDNENTLAKGELMMIGYDPKSTNSGYTCKWVAEELVDSVHFVFVASEQDKTSHGYGKFLNQIESVLQSIAQKLKYKNDKEELIVRFHQHIGFHRE